MTCSTAFFALAAIIVALSAGTLAGLAVHALVRPEPFTDANRCLSAAIAGIVVALLAAGTALALMGL